MDLGALGAFIRPRMGNPVDGETPEHHDDEFLVIIDWIGLAT